MRTSKPTSGFTRQFAQFAAGYPPLPDEGMKLQSYWDSLKDYPPEVIARIFEITLRRDAERARNGAKIFFPALPALLAVAPKASRDIDGINARDKNSRRFHPGEPANLPSSNPFQQLAETWEAESRALNLNPHKAPPQEIAQRRARELRQAWETHATGPLKDAI